MTFKALSTLGSKLRTEIAGTYVDVPGTQNFTPDPGEEGTFETGDITSTYDTLGATQVGSGGSVSGTKLLDPLDPVDQYLQACKNNGGIPTTPTAGYTGIPGKAHLSESGVIWDWDGILTKWTPKAEKKSGWMVDFEFKLADRMELNEADPA